MAIFDFQVPVSGLKTDGLFDLHTVESAPTWLTGGEFGLEGSILATAAEVCTAIILILALKSRVPEILIAEAAAESSAVDASMTS